MDNAPQPPRLNVQALPTNTDRRFALLIFAILSTNLYIFRSLLLTQFLGLTQSWSVTHILNSDYTSCIKQSLASSSSIIGGLPFHCSWSADGLLLLLLLAGTVLLLLVAFLIYWLLPILKCRREHLEPWRANANESEMAAVIHSVKQLQQTHIPSIPHIHFMRDVGNSGMPMVFAGLGRHYLVLTDGALYLSTVHPDEFRAIILHEFAHFQNKDASKLYFALSISCSFILTSLLPFIFVLVWSLINLRGSLAANLGFILSEIFGILSMTGLIFFVYQSILRSRETFADILSSAWVGSPTFLLQAINLLPPEKTPWWRTAFFFHPSAQQRLDAIEDPRRAFHLKFWEAFAIGITFGAALPSLSDIANTTLRLLFGLGLYIPFSVTWPDPGMLLLCLLVAFIIGQMLF
jgi:Zn-dependent protease with chaperone function